jgi:BlaI family transcriptional regulator, penicillinase repressor
MMAKSNEMPPLPSDAQLEVLNVVWDRGEATVGEVWRTVAGLRPVARNTVLTLMTRLEEKGWLRRHSDGNVNRYSAAINQATGLRQIARRLVDTAFRGSTEGLVMTLLEGGDLSEAEATRIRTMLQAAGRQNNRRNK